MPKVLLRASMKSWKNREKTRNCNIVILFRSKSRPNSNNISASTSNSKRPNTTTTWRCQCIIRSKPTPAQFSAPSSWDYSSTRVWVGEKWGTRRWLVRGLPPKSITLNLPQILRLPPKNHLFITKKSPRISKNTSPLWPHLTNKNRSRMLTR